MAESAAHKAARAKAAKQKKRLAFLMLPLALAGFYAYHTLSKAGGSSSAPPPPAATASTSPAPTAPGSTTASPATAAAPAAQGTDGKLASLTLLSSKDPFGGAAGQSSSSVPTSSTPPPPPAVVTTSKPVQPQPKQSQPQKSQQKTSQPVQPQPQKPQHKSKKLYATRKAAVLAFNGMLTKIRLHKSFGHDPNGGRDPVFWVVTINHKTARIVVIGKVRAYTLKVDVPRTLKDLHGNLYTLMLLPKGTPLPSVPSNGGAAPTTTTPRNHGG